VKKKYRYDTSKCIKRVNPETNEPFSRGDIVDGMVFDHYDLHRFNTKDRKFFAERWYTERHYNERTRHRAKLKKASAKRVKDRFKEKPNPRRLNPNTGKEFVRGDIFEGNYFVHYIPTNHASGYQTEYWVDSYERFLERCCKQVCKGAQERSAKEGLDFDLTWEYIYKIFPKDSKCPILGIDISFGNWNNDSSASLDKKDPTKGYTEDNVEWLSGRANRLKSNASAEELEKIVAHMKKK
tara:strand:+ start:61 stop:777 length:717 start_codon:yes stop_codon:yes gene_type:complete